MSKILKHINIDLTPASINRAIQEIATFKSQLLEGIMGLCERLLDEGVDVAKAQIMSMPAVDTGALMASIGHGAFDRNSGVGIIYAGSYYAIFVEFGTGIVGAANSHPLAGQIDASVLGANGTVYSEYDTNKHGTDGWFYRKIGESKYSWTKGMPARPFMYNTGMTLETYARERGGEIIAQYVK